MALFKPIEFDYTKLRGMDIFFSNGFGIVGGMIRLGEMANFKAMTDRTIPNHVGFIYDDRGQFFAAEVTPRGIGRTSLELYKGRTNQIIEVYRWAKYDDSTIRENALQRLAEEYRRRQDCGYDWWGAVKASPLARKLFPWLKQNSKKPFCSEDVSDFLACEGMIEPLAWKTQKPNPLQLRDWIKNKTAKIEGWKK
jgi:hypothetical protein